MKDDAAEKMCATIPPRRIPTVADPFREFHPVPWYPSQMYVNTGSPVYSIKRNHGVAGVYKLHNLNDAINDDRPVSEKVIVEYCINGLCFPLFTAADLLDSSYPYDLQAEGNILGEIAERIARRTTKYFLKHLSKRGKTGGVFDSRFNPQHREDFIIANTSEYILKIQKYPNLIILRRTGKGKFGYENIKELDGFFDYRYCGKRHIIVLESKLDKINVDCGFLVENLFKPLRELFPEASFHYLLFSDRYSIYSRTNFDRWRQLKKLPLTISEALAQHGVGSLYFTFNESHDDFVKIKDFLIVQYRSLKNLSYTLVGKTVVSDKELTLFDGGETPHIKLVKDAASGLWRQVSLHHKRGAKHG